MGVSTGELVRRLRETLPPYQQKRLSHVVMPGPGRKAHQLNWALRPEVLREILTEETDPRRVFVGVSDADSIPDRTPIAGSPSGSSAGGEPRLPGHPALPRQLRPARHSREDLRDPAVVDLHPRVDRAPAQRGQARAAPGAPRPRARRAWPGWCVPPSSSSSGAPRSAWATTSSCAWTAAGGGRLSDLGRHRGLHARLRAGPPRRADPGAAHGGGDRSPRDLRGRDPAERALVPGRARRHPVPLARLADGAHRLQPGPARAAHRQQGGGVADRRRWSTRSRAGSAGIWPTTTRATASGSTWPPARPPCRCC